MFGLRVTFFDSSKTHYLLLVTQTRRKGHFVDWELHPPVRRYLIMEGLECSVIGAIYGGEEEPVGKGDGQP